MAFGSRRHFRCVYRHRLSQVLIPVLVVMLSLLCFHLGLAPRASAPLAIDVLAAVVAVLLLLPLVLIFLVRLEL